MHVHGCLEEVNDPDLYVRHSIRDEKAVELRHSYVRSELQFGNPYNNPQNMKEYLGSIRVKPKNQLFELDSLKQELEYFLSFTQKDMDKNIEGLKRFLSMANWPDKVIVMGCSLSEIDMKYYEEVLFPMYSNVLWEFYCHSEEDFINAKRISVQNKLVYKLIKW